MRIFQTVFAAVVLSFGAVACAWMKQEAPSEAVDQPAVSEQEEAYQACLERSQAMAIVWEMIEQMCREEVGLEEAESLALPE